MKKYCLVTFLFAVLVSMPMFAYDFVQNGIYYNIEDDHVSVTYSGNGVYTGSVSIPSQVTYNGVTYPVTAIGEWAFEGGEGMTYLSIPSSITSIGEYAFIDCGSNIEVRIADLTAWCKITFGNVHSSPLSSAKKFYLYSTEVKQLVIPEGVESIPNYAFYQCRSITSLNIAGSVKSIGSSAFEDCTGLTSIYLFEGVESIGGSSFEGCTNLSTIIFPSTLSSIALNAFKNCGNLNTIVSRIQEPFTFLDNVFCTYSTATVTVPEGTTTAYRSTDGWNLFDNITDESSQDPTKRTIHVATAGTLPNLISADEKYQIEELTLTGELNGTDLGYLREMAGAAKSEYKGSHSPTPGILRILDISNVTIVKGGNYYYLWTEQSKEDYEYDYLEDDNIIPSRVFRNCKRLTSVTIPNSVTSIGRDAFYNTGWYNNQANGLLYLDKWLLGYKGDKPVGELIITEGTKGIAGDAFWDCSGLTSVTIPSSVTSIGNYSFYNCSSLTSVAIPNSVTSIGSGAFWYCSGLSSVAIPNSVTSIGSWAFGYCSGLTSVTIPNSVTSIVSYAFYGCSGLTSVTIPNSVTSIVSYAFSRCSGLTSVTIPNSVTSIGDYAFSYCSSLTSVTIPNSVTSIGSWAFGYCSGLTSVAIPNSVTSIGNYAFYGCSGLTTIISEIEDPFAIGDNVFNSSGKDIYATATLIVPEGKKSAYESTEGWKEFKNIIEIGGIGYEFEVDGIKYKVGQNNTLSVISKTEKYSGSVVIPESVEFLGKTYSVTSIGNDAFYICSGLTSVTIPKSIKTINEFAFHGCTGLTSVYISDLEAWCKIRFYEDGPGDSYSSNPLHYAHHLYLNEVEVKEIEIPNTISYIGTGVFDGGSNFTSVIIPNSVKSIGSSAFYGCSSLTNITIPNSAKSIGKYAFAFCSGLTSVTIPNSVTSIGIYTFYYCSGLTSVTIPNSVTSIGEYAFYKCIGLTSIVSLNSNPPSVTYSSTFTNVDKNNCVVWVPKGSLSAYKGANGWKDFANIFELVEGDLNLDDVVDQNDMDALVGFVMGKNPEGFYEGLADLNGDNKIDAADVVKMVDLLSASSELGTVSQFVIENSVVSSLTCTLNNERSEAIQLTKYELYCNHNLVSYQSFSGASASVAAGGSKECTFNNLAKLNSSTGFTVCWYYTANGKNYVYRCPLKE